MTTKQAKVAIGNRIYYTGDMANPSDWGTVTSVSPLDVVIHMDTGHDFHVYPTGIGSVYRGHCNPRFVTDSAVRRYKRDAH